MSLSSCMGTRFMHSCRCSPDYPTLTITPGYRSAAKGAVKEAAGTSYEQQYIRAVIELHDKYIAYVNTCFSNTSLFHKSLKEAFESFCNKNVAGTSSAELMANFCDNLLKKVHEADVVITSENIKHRFQKQLYFHLSVFHPSCLPAQPQGGSEKLSDEAIEETLDKVVKLLAYINDKVRIGRQSKSFIPKPISKD